LFQIPLGIEGTNASVDAIQLGCKDVCNTSTTTVSTTTSSDTSITEKKKKHHRCKKHKTEGKTSFPTDSKTLYVDKASSLTTKKDDSCTHCGRTYDKNKNTDTESHGSVILYKSTKSESSEEDHKKKKILPRKYYDDDESETEVIVRKKHTKKAVNQDY
jgi:hypothetical protein